MQDANALALGGMGDIFESELKPADPTIFKDHWNQFMIKNYGVSRIEAATIVNKYETKNSGKGTPACF